MNYDMMSGKELRAEVLKRGYKCSYQKKKFVYRQILIEDDKKKAHPIECPNTSPILPKA